MSLPISFASPPAPPPTGLPWRLPSGASPTRRRLPRDGPLPQASPTRHLPHPPAAPPPGTSPTHRRLPHPAPPPPTGGSPTRHLPHPAPLPPDAATTWPPASSAGMLLGAPVDGWIDGRGCVCDMEGSCRSAVAGLDTLLPLHTAVASARLKSCIAVDSTCWCSLSQGKPAQRLTPHLHWLDVSVSD
ncbi:hypothetical protein ZWY2020_053684 [Hordeum vulgare]|nr:hypothetical protein ZWY2020_053684 [Hordeum vulgare]